jgi:hypothetical protein
MPSSKWRLLAHGGANRPLNTSRLSEATLTLYGRSALAAMELEPIAARAVENALMLWSQSACNDCTASLSVLHSPLRIMSDQPQQNEGESK